MLFGFVVVITLVATALVLLFGGGRGSVGWRSLGGAGSRAALRRRLAGAGRRFRWRRRRRGGLCRHPGKGRGRGRRGAPPRRTAVPPLPQPRRGTVHRRGPPQA